MIKKKKRSERASFLFDDDAGKSTETIDLFGSDDDAPEEQPEPAIGEPTDGEPVPPEADEPLDTAAEHVPAKPKKADKPSETPTFRFDRYGRRVGKKKARYGKRKNAPKARTTVVEHDTEAKREYDEARARSRARAEKRAREEARQAELKKAERKKRRQRSTSTMIMGILEIGRAHV